MDGAWVTESVVEVAADMLGVFSSLEVLAQPPRRIGKQLVQGCFCIYSFDWKSAVEHHGGV